MKSAQTFAYAIRLIGSTTELIHSMGVGVGALEGDNEAKLCVSRVPIEARNTSNALFCDLCSQVVLIQTGDSNLRRPQS